MKAFIFGGINSKSSHFKRLFNVYKKFDPEFISLSKSFMDLSFLNEDIIHNKVQKVVYNISQQNKPIILHGFSGGCIYVDTIAKMINPELVVYESGPVKPSLSSYQNYLHQTIGINSSNLTKTIIKYYGIPISIEYQEKLFKSKYKSIVLIGKNDKIVDRSYIKDKFDNIKEFENCGHGNISKICPIEYENILLNAINNKYDFISKL